jgi:3-keto-5-aminohexanoate cleavage enzyme
MEKLIIEVALNENQSKRDNPNVPITPAEIAADALRCLNAGASVIHFHAREPETGEPRMGEASLYAEAFRRIQAEADAVIYPTYPYYDDPARRWAHLRALAADRTVKLEMGVIDMGTNNMAGFRDGKWTAEERIYSNPITHIRHLLETCRELGIAPSPVVRDTGQLRTVLAFRQEGLIPDPSLFRIYLHGDQLWGLDPTIESVQVYARMLPPGGGVSWMASAYGPENFRINAFAALAGGHVRTGLGDNVRGDGDDDSNPKLVERIVTLARMLGREVASPDEARALMGIQGRPIAQAGTSV